MDINVDLLQWFIHFLKKKSSATAATRADKSAVESEIISNQHLTKELH